MSIALQEAVEPPNSQRCAPSPPPARPATERRTKLSFKDRHALETLPARIAELEREIAAQQTALSDSSLYERDATRFHRITEALATAEAARAEAEEQWLRLEIMREELERR